MSTEWLVVAAIGVVAAVPWVLMAMRAGGAPTLDLWRAGRVSGSEIP